MIMMKEGRKESPTELPGKRYLALSDLLGQVPAHNVRRVHHHGPTRRVAAQKEVAVLAADPFRVESFDVAFDHVVQMDRLGE